MKKIPLTQGKFALVDDADYEFLMQWKWHFKKSRDMLYAARSVKGGSVFMHRAVHPVSDGDLVDHKNCNTLDNRRENLRSCCKTKNGHNRRKNKNGSSPYKGVSFHKSVKKFCAGIRVQKKRIHLGVFDDPKLAAYAYDTAAFDYFGEFARLNFPNRKASA